MRHNGENGVSLTVSQASNSSKSSDGDMRHITIHAEDEVKKSWQCTGCSVSPVSSDSSHRQNTLWRRQEAAAVTRVFIWARGSANVHSTMQLQYKVSIFFRNNKLQSQVKEWGFIQDKIFTFGGVSWQTRSHKYTDIRDRHIVADLWCSEVTMSEKRKDLFNQILSEQQKKLVWHQDMFCISTVKMKSHAKVRGTLMRSSVTAVFTLVVNSVRKYHRKALQHNRTCGFLLNHCYYNDTTIIFTAEHIPTLTVSAST